MATAGESPQAKEGSRHNGLVRAVDGIFSTRALLDLAIEYSGSTGLDEFLGTHRCLFFSTCGEGGASAGGFEFRQHIGSDRHWSTEEVSLRQCGYGIGQVVGNGRR